MLKVNSISVSYGKLQAIRDIRIEVAENDFVAVIGSNGAGKTTLLRAISGLTRISSGSIEFKGRKAGWFTAKTNLRDGDRTSSRGQEDFSFYEGKREPAIRSLFAATSKAHPGFSQSSLSIVPSAERTAESTGKDFVRRRTANVGRRAWVDVPTAAVDFGRADTWFITQVGCRDAHELKAAQRAGNYDPARVTRSGSVFTTIPASLCSRERPGCPGRNRKRTVTE